jgi:hypothetical protein
MLEIAGVLKVGMAIVFGLVFGISSADACRALVTEKAGVIPWGQETRIIRELERLFQIHALHDTVALEVEGETAKRVVEALAEHPDFSDAGLFWRYAARHFDEGWVVFRDFEIQVSAGNRHYAYGFAIRNCRGKPTLFGYYAPLD